MKQEKSGNSYDFVLKQVAKNIQNHRKKSRITQEGMEAHGFNYKHYQKLEGGKHSMSFYTLYRLAKIFKTDIASFLKDLPNQKKKRA